MAAITARTPRCGSPGCVPFCSTIAVRTCSSIGRYSGDGLGDGLVAEAGIGAGAERSRFDRHHPDAQRRNLFAENLGDGLDGELRRAVVAEIR